MVGMAGNPWTTSVRAACGPDTFWSFPLAGTVVFLAGAVLAPVFLVGVEVLGDRVVSALSAAWLGSVGCECHPSCLNTTTMPVVDKALSFHFYSTGYGRMPKGNRGRTRGLNAGGHLPVSYVHFT